MSPPLRTLVAATLGTLALFGSGCAETVIDDVKAQETTQASLENSLHEKIKAVDCPSELKVDPGTTFTCTVERSHGTQATVTLKIRDKDADLSIVGFEQNE